MNKNTDILKWIGLGVFVLLAFIAYNLIIPRHLTKEDCLKLGSNYRTAECMNLINSATPVPTSEPFDVSEIQISNRDMSGNTYYSSNPTYTATLKNNGDIPAYDIYMKFKFFNNGTDANCDYGDPEDTQYIKVSNVIMSQDSQKIKVVIPTNFDTSGRFVYCDSIYSATSTPQNP